MCDPDIDFRVPRVTRARNLITRAELDFGRTLTAGERIDLIAEMLPDVLDLKDAMAILAEVERS